MFFCVAVYESEIIAVKTTTVPPPVVTKLKIETSRKLMPQEIDLIIDEIDANDDSIGSIDVLDPIVSILTDDKIDFDDIDLDDDIMTTIKTKLTTTSSKSSTISLAIEELKEMNIIDSDNVMITVPNELLNITTMTSSSFKNKTERKNITSMTTTGTTTTTTTKLFQIFNPCNPNPCNSGKCISIRGGYRCRCPPGVMGKRCQISMLNYILDKFVNLKYLLN
jgi:hypothetical protein